VPALYERAHTNKNSTIHREAMKHIKSFLRCEENENDMNYFKELSIAYNETDLEGHLRIATIYGYSISGFVSKSLQLQNYDFVSEKSKNELLSSLEKHIPKLPSVRYEVGVSTSEIVSNTNVTISGILDICTNNTVFEIKCTQDLTDEARMQLALYAWIVMKDNIIGKSALSIGENVTFELLNIRTGRLERLNSTFDELNAAATLLIAHFLRNEVIATDEEFVAYNVNNITSKPSLLVKRVEPKDIESDANKFIYSVKIENNVKKERKKRSTSADKGAQLIEAVSTVEKGEKNMIIADESNKKRVSRSKSKEIKVPQKKIVIDLQ
jgi:hypothetical protein